MKLLTRVMFALLLVLVLAVSFLCDIKFFAPTRYTARTIELTSEKIGSGMDGMKIACFSDLDYGTFMDKKRLKKFVDYVNDQSPDVIIFTGDIFDDGIPLSEPNVNDVTELLTSLSAPYGKFAVLGDKDETSEERSADIKKMLAACNFELVQNSSLPIHKGGLDYISIVGLANRINGTPDAETAFANVSRTAYTLVFSHNAETCEKVPYDLTDRYFAGHTHGGQFYWLFGSLVKPDSHTIYMRGSHDIGGHFTLDITNGVGTVMKDIRLFCNPEVVIYVLHPEKAEEEPAVLEPDTVPEEIPDSEVENPEDDQSQDSEYSEEESYEDNTSEEDSGNESAEEN